MIKEILFAFKKALFEWVFVTVKGIMFSAIKATAPL